MLLASKSLLAWRDRLQLNSEEHRKPGRFLPVVPVAGLHFEKREISRFVLTTLQRETAFE